MSATAPPESLTASATVFLKQYPPFDEMEEHALDVFASRLSLGYYPEGTTILSPDDGEPVFLYVIRSGMVHLEGPAMPGQPIGAPTALAPGECFSVGALLERRPTGSRY